MEGSLKKSMSGIFSEEDPDFLTSAEKESVVVQSKITGDYVLYFTPKSGKPRDYPSMVRRARRPRVHERVALDPNCPFCPGNEDKCSLEIARLNGAQWSARCFLNRFPILHDLDDPNPNRARGKMEVIVSGRKHNECLAQYSSRHLFALIKFWRDRYETLFLLDQTEHVTMFVNHGQRAGGSLQHAHLQTVALGFVPPRLHNFFLSCDCALCTPTIPPQKIVYENECCRAFADVAPYSGTIFITPKRCQPRISMASEVELRAFAKTLKNVVRSSYSCYDDPDFNLSIFNAPKSCSSSFHWFATYVPHLSEDCSCAMVQYGLACSAMSPERAASALRDHTVAFSSSISSSDSSSSSDEADNE